MGLPYLLWTLPLINQYCWKQRATEVIANMPRRDNAAPDKGDGDPHMNWDDKPLSESETCKRHKSAKQVKPPKKA